MTAASITDPTTAPAGPQGFQLSDPPVYYDITTTAQYTSPITVCIGYGTLPGVNPANLEVNHYENGAWVNRTSSIDTTTSTICATVTSLSPFAIFINQSVTTVAVPNVVGLTQSVATSAITSAGLAIGTVTTQSSNTVPAGIVISQNPAASTSVNTGSAVSLVVSSGPPQVAVPNVVGMTQATATTAINSAGLVLGAVTTQSSSTVPAGSVISQNPAAGTNVISGSAVSLVVSSGPPQVAVPNVVGMTQATATTAINSAGLVLGAVTTQSSSTVPAGSVISQNPAAGTNVISGSAVSLVVSSGGAGVLVPKVVGLSLLTAYEDITKAGLKIGTLMPQQSDDVRFGYIIRQTPMPGTTVNLGSVVSLVVSVGDWD